MKKDAAARAAILTALERQLKKGDKSFVGNKGYRRFLATPGDDHFAIDRAKAEEDAKFDGIFVLWTNADLTPLEAMLCYKRLWMVERAFRTSKSLFVTRPIFHKLDETIRGHVSCSFLALVLKKELEDRIATMGKSAAASDNAENGSWPDVLADLDLLTATEVEQDGKRFLLRSAPCPAPPLRAAGVRSAPDSASTCRRLIPPPPGDQRKCSAKAPFQHGFIRAANALQILTVEDQFGYHRVRALGGADRGRWRGAGPEFVLARRRAGNGSMKKGEPKIAPD